MTTSILEMRERSTSVSQAKFTCAFRGSLAMSFRLWKEKEKTAMVGEDRMGDRSARCKEGHPSEGHEKKPLPWFLFFLLSGQLTACTKGPRLVTMLPINSLSPIQKKGLRAFMSLRLVPSSTAAIRALMAW